MTRPALIAIAWAGLFVALGSGINWLAGALP